MKGKKISFQFVAAAALALLVVAPVLAAPHSLATVHAGASGIEWQPAVSGVGMVLSVSGPNGFYFRQEFQAGESATFSLYDKVGQVRPAGQYVWELTPVVHPDAATADEIAAARQAGDTGTPGARQKAGKAPAGAQIQSGSFRIAGQSILAGGESEPGAGKPAAPAGNSLSAKDQVIADDLIVQGSECVGLDCVNNESFGFDTIRLKENNTRIKFEDTSVGTFPTTDWQLTANDSASGGANKFSIEDVTDAKVPLTITGNAPTNSIFVDSTGRVGLRTSTPVLDLHIATGNTPAIRLEQNNSSGFSAQTWDLAGNESNFFIRDVTGGSKLPFRIVPGAPSNSLYIKNTGDVGIGTASPNRALTVVDTGAADNTVVEISNDGPARIRLNNTANGEVWNLGHQSPGGSGLVLSDVGDAVSEFLLDVNGNVTIAGTITTTGSCSGGCDRVFASDHPVESIEDHAAEMWAKSYLPAIGPTPESGPFNVSTMTGGMLNELEKAHIYIAQLNEQVKGREAEISELKKELEALEQTVNGLVDKK